MNKDKRVIERQIRLMNNFTKLVNGIFFKNDTIDGKTVFVHRSLYEIRRRINDDIVAELHNKDSFLNQGFTKTVESSVSITDVGDCYIVYFKSNDAHEYTDTLFAKVFKLNVGRILNTSFNAFIVIPKPNGFVHTIKDRPRRTCGKFIDMEWNKFIDEIKQKENNDMTEKSVEFVGAPTEKNIRSKIAELVNLLIQPELDQLSRIEDQIKEIQEQENKLKKQRQELNQARDSLGQDINDKKNKIIWDL